MDWTIVVGDGRWKVGRYAIIAVGWREWMSYGAWIYDVSGWLWKEVGGGWEREGLHSWSLVIESNGFGINTLHYYL